MRILILNSDYQTSLNWLYRTQPALANASYAVQLKARNDCLFGLADHYSRNFTLHGHEAKEIHFNNLWLQSAWAREHGMKAISVPPPEKHGYDNPAVARLKLSLRRYRSVLLPVARRVGLAANMSAQARAVLHAQVEEFKPDIIFNQDITTIGSSEIKRMVRKDRIFIAYCGIDPPNDDFSNYTFCLSMLDWVVEHFRAQGVVAERNFPGFEATINDRLGPAPERDIPISFVGSLSADHKNRIKLLEGIAERHPLALWVPSLNAVSANSPLRQINRGEAFGRDLYQIMRRSKITLNTHVGAARGQAANMRQFESTGVGSLLLTDNAGNLADIFEPGVEAVRYNSVDDALEKIAYYLKNEDERAAIAKAGQTRTLASHTYFHRTAQILDYVNRYGP